MIEYEESFVSVDDAMAYYKKQRRAAVEPVYLCLDFPGRGQVQCTLTRKSIMRVYSINPAGKMRFGSLWDAKAGQLDRLMREALEEAYASERPVAWTHARPYHRRARRFW